MKKFDELYENYIFQSSTLLEAEDSSTFTGMLGSAKNFVTGGKPILNVPYKPTNVYYLKDGHKSLEILKNKLSTILAGTPPSTYPPQTLANVPADGTKITGKGTFVGNKFIVLPASSSPTPLKQNELYVQRLNKNGTAGGNRPQIINRLTSINEANKITVLHEAAPPPQVPMYDDHGTITDKPAFATLFINRLDEAIASGINYITIQSLLDYKRNTQTKYGNVNPVVNISKDKYHASIMKFITDNRLQDLIIYATPEQAKEMDKGGFWKNTGKALDKLASTAIKDLGKNLVNLKTLIPSPISTSGGTIY